MNNHDGDHDDKRNKPEGFYLLLIFGRLASRVYGHKGDSCALLLDFNMWRELIFGLDV